MINQENWTYCHYELGAIRAQVTFGGEPTVEGDMQPLYFCSILDSDHQEIAQKSFPDLDGAMGEINQHCEKWTFVDAFIKPQGSGCSSCVAH